MLGIIDLSLVPDLPIGSTPLNKFLEFIEENFSPMGNGMWLCNHSADEEFSGQMVIDQFEREVNGIDKWGNKINK